MNNSHCFHLHGKERCDTEIDNYKGFRIKDTKDSYSGVIFFLQDASEEFLINFKNEIKWLCESMIRERRKDAKS